MPYSITKHLVLLVLAGLVLASTTVLLATLVLTRLTSTTNCVLLVATSLVLTSVSCHFYIKAFDFFYTRFQRNKSMSDSLQF